MTIQRTITSENKAQPFHANCLSREILELIGGKWSLLILCLLKSGPMRTGLIMRSVEGISQKMLTQTLRELERAGMVERKSYPEVPPRVEYRLTPLGTTLSVLVLQLEHWVVDNYEQVNRAQSLFDTLASGYPEAQEFAEKNVLKIPTSAEATEHFERMTEEHWSQEG